MLRLSFAILILALVSGGHLIYRFTSSAFAATDPKKVAPRVLVALPLGVPAGKTTRVVLRGLKLDRATAVRLRDSKATAKLIGKGKVGVPNMQEAGKVGDTQVTVEVTVPAGHPDATIPVIVTTPEGESEPGKLLIDARPVSQEKEPNEGFRRANLLPLPGVIQGAITNPLDVDTFAFQGLAGQTVILEIFAARLGSALDSVLTVYDDRYQVLGSNDDLGSGSGGTDSRLELRLPRTGCYFVSVQDAHDTGGPVHVYRLSVSFRRPPEPRAK